DAQATSVRAFRRWSRLQWSVVAVVALAGAFSSALFVVFDRSVLRPVVFEDSERVIHLDVPYGRLLAQPGLIGSLPARVAELGLEAPTYLETRSLFEFGDTGPPG